MTNLKRLRTERGLTQQELADALDVAQNTVSQWELGARSLDAHSLRKVASFFGVSADTVLGLDSGSPSPAVGSFEYAFHQESRHLSDEDKEELLRMARRMRELMEYRREREGRP